MAHGRGWPSGTWGAVTLTANVVSWHAAAFTLAALAVSGALRLLVERQRQQAFKAMVSGGPGDGVLMMEHDGLKARYMRAGLPSRPPRHSPGGA
jgi:hypothetical protein